MAPQSWQKMLLLALLQVSGAASQMVHCQNTWSHGPCSVTCGTGTQLVSPVITVAAANGGTSCPSSYRAVCSMPACPANGNGNGNNGNGNNGNGNGNGNGNNRVHCQNTWSSGPCSVTCGMGTQLMNPVITVPAANGGSSCPSSYTAVCNMPACPPPNGQGPTLPGQRVDCQHTLSYGPCSASCGMGTQLVTPVVTVAAQNGGSACPSSFRAVCNMPACPPAGPQMQPAAAPAPPMQALPAAPVHCQNTWSAGPCSVTCGMGTLLMNPVITVPAANGGSSCPSSYAAICNMPACPAPPGQGPANVPGSQRMDCQNTWSFGPCSASCDVGTQLVTPVVTVAAQNGGASCPSSYRAICHMPACPPAAPLTQPAVVPAVPQPLPNGRVDCQNIWDIGVCSVTCGQGTQLVRPIVTVQAVNGGASCPSSYRRICDMPACPAPPALLAATAGVPLDGANANVNDTASSNYALLGLLSLLVLPIVAVAALIFRARRANPLQELEMPQITVDLEASPKFSVEPSVTPAVLKEIPSYCCQIPSCSPTPNC